MSSTATVTVLFCDVVGSTERLVRIGDVAGDTLRRDLFGRLRQVVTSSGGLEVKNLGDGLMVVFRTSAVAALVCAREMHLAASTVDANDPVQLRIGISIGEVMQEDGDWFGLPVVEAARLCAAAGAEQTLANALVRTLVGTRAADHGIHDFGELTLKGLARPMSVVEVSWRDAGRSPPTTGADASSDAAENVPRGASPQAPYRRRASDRRRRKARLATTVVGGIAVIALSAFGIAAISTDRDEQVVGTDTSTTGADVVTAPRGYEPKYRPTECSAEQSESVPGVECGELVVPESRDDPDGSIIAIPVMKKSADGATTADPVVIVDVNEPLARTSLTEVADVYALSLRGSTPGVGPDLDCGELRTAWIETLSLRPTDVVGIERRAEAASQCAARLRSEGVHLEGYSLAEIAQDIRDLVATAGLERVTVVGGGHLTPAVVAFARSNPGAVGAMILTNPVRPGSSALADPAGTLASTLSHMVDMCAADPSCKAQHPNLAQDYEAGFTTFDQDPMLVTTTPIGGTTPLTAAVDGRRFAAALEAVVRQSGQLGLVPEAVKSAEVDLIAATGIDEEVKWYAGPAARAGALLSLTCSYDAEPNLSAELSAKAVPQFAGANEPTFRRLCEEWGVPSVYEEMSQPLYGALPTLLVDGGFSVSGTNRWAEAMAGQLDDATLVHLAAMSDDLAYAPPPCLRRLRNEFATAPGRDLDREIAACEAGSAAIDFVGST